METAKKTQEERGAGFRRYKTKNLVIELLPIIVLALLFAIYMTVITIRGYKMELQLTRLFNQAIVLVTVATGATFIYALGSFDISLGASVLFACTMGVLTYNATSSVALLLLVIVACGVGCSLLSASLATFFKIPPFVTTVAMMSVLSAIATTLININNTSGGTASITLPLNLLDPFSSVWIKALIAGAFILLCVFVFNFTKVGRRIKFLGGNPTCAKLSGIPASVYTIIAFGIAGLGVGIGALLTLAYTPSVSSGTAGSIGMNIFVAIVFGGMPISGGAKSKIYTSLIGGFSYMLLNQILLWLIGTSMNGVAQIISAALFLLIVFLTSLNYRTRLLPR